MGGEPTAVVLQPGNGTLNEVTKIDILRIINITA
jgi:hypothetical protein